MNSPRPRASLILPLGIAVGLSLLGDLSLYTVLVTQLDATGLSLAAAGVMLGVNRLVRLPVNPLAGLLFDRWGRRPLFLIGMALAVLTTASYGLIHGFWPFLFARILWGVAWTLINVGGRTIALDISLPGDIGRTAGQYNTAVWTGFAAGPLAGGLLTALLGFRSAMLICAALTAVGFLVALAWLEETAPAGSAGPERERLAQERPRIERLNRERSIGSGPLAHDAASDLREGASSTRGTTHAKVAPSYFALHVPGALRDICVPKRLAPRLAAVQPLLAIVFIVSQFAGEDVARSTFTLLLQERLGETVSLGPWALAVAAASGLFLGLRAALAGAAGPIAGRLADTRLGRWPALAAGLGLAAVALVLQALARSTSGILIATALAALAASATFAVLLALAGDLAPRGQLGFVMGLYATAGDAGLMLGPFVSFALLPALGLTGVYLLCAALLVACVCATLPTARRSVRRAACDELQSGQAGK